jgi:hypothetical protein
MTTDIELARQRVAAKKVWGRVSERAILTGQWDEGDFIKDELQQVRFERAALKEVNPDD